MNYKEEYTRWCTSPEFDEKTKKELREIEKNEKEIEDRFYKELEFGTAGLRGVIGAGTNRMNRYTVGKATQGLANYIKKQHGEQKGVAIAYDSRHMSEEFSKEAALILNANGIKTYRFTSLRPVPELSFTVRELGCIAGIMITASHNPPKYNGYKVYWEDGAQIVAPKDKEIIQEVRNIQDYAEIQKITEEQAKKQGLYQEIDQEIDEKYMQTIQKLVLNPDTIKKQSEMKIVYTPLHGTGNLPVREILKRLGFQNVYVVPEQALPDGDFPTVDYPNPEDPKAFTLALKLAKEKDADLVLATDPDADRLGVYAKDSKTGEYHSFTGNMSGLLLAEYEISQKKEKGILPENGAIIKSIVSSNLADAIAEHYHLTLIDVLTGFKYIGEKIKEFEQTKEYEYVFGFEESYGCLIGTHARDKDAIVAVMVLCEAAAYYKEKGLTLWDQMQNIYQTYGYYKEDILSVTLEGAEGGEKIKAILENLRKEPLTKIAEISIVAFSDYQEGYKVTLKTGEKEKTTLPTSNVLYYDLENHAWCCVRPSGTEPKIKFYMGVCEKTEQEAKEKIDKMKQFMKEIVAK